MSQFEGVSRDSVGQTYGSSAASRIEDESAISRDLGYATGLVDATGDNARLFKERRKLFKWLDSLDNRWLGVGNIETVKGWLKQENRECFLCRKLADNLSQIIRNSSISNALGVLFSVGNLVYAILLGYYMRELETVGPDKRDDVMLSFFIMVCVTIAFALTFFCFHMYDSNRRNRLAFELMKFSNSVPGECDIPCAMHRTSCSKQAAPTPRDDSHKGQATQEG